MTGKRKVKQAVISRATLPKPCEIILLACGDFETNSLRGSRPAAVEGVLRPSGKLVADLHSRLGALEAAVAETPLFVLQVQPVLPTSPVLKQQASHKPSCLSAGTLFRRESLS